MSGTQRSLTVVSPGPQLLVQDGGRPGHLALGVAPSGFADPDAAGLANRLVGNPSATALLESLLGDVELRNDSPRAVTVAITGVEARVHVGGRAAGTHSPLTIRPGESLLIGFADTGTRAYIAARGGIAVRLVLGSASYDTLAGLGPALLAAGDTLALGDAATEWPHVDHAAARPTSAELELPVRLGPRDEWLTHAGLARLLTQRWRVGAQSDRTGFRLEGEPLELFDRRELDSEGTVKGAVEVPHDGRPIVLMADHPVTVGYPVVAVVQPSALGSLAQSRPGRLVRFTLARPPVP